MAKQRTNLPVVFLFVAAFIAGAVVSALAGGGS